jgi:redox-sensing transcriptional repressor
MKQSPLLTGVPEPTVRRLPNYLSHIKVLKKLGVESVSAPQIASDFNFDPTQVTKDLSYTGITGKTKIGYNINDLIKALEDFLGYNRVNLAFLVGAGNLGSALLKYEAFENTGLKIVAAFDTDLKKVGNKIGNIDIFHLDKFKNLAERIHCQIGIITTPAEVSQSVAEMMISWGIKAIWNFTPVIIKVPDGIIIENTSIYSNLAVIINKLERFNHNKTSNNK